MTATTQILLVVIVLHCVAARHWSDLCLCELNTNMSSYTGALFQDPSRVTQLYCIALCALACGKLSLPAA